MKGRADVPEALVDGGLMPGSTGFFEPPWFYEEAVGAARLGIRVQARLHEETSACQKITIYDTTFFGKVLTLDDVVMLTERDEFVYHEMLVHVPLCSVDEPGEILIIGGGDCGCLREVLRHPCVKRVVQVDIDERVTRVCGEHFAWVRRVEADPRAELRFEDGAAYVGRQAGAFDVVIVDSTDPKGPGVGLFTRGFYAEVARSLKPGGVMVAQTESPHWDPAMVAAIFGEIRGAFGRVSAYQAPVPTYPSGHWTFCYASADRSPGDFLDEERALGVARGCRYYNPLVHKASFALPNFFIEVLRGENPFQEFDARHRLGPGAEST
jgi:spermidine synthase